MCYPTRDRKLCYFIAQKMDALGVAGEQVTALLFVLLFELQFDIDCLLTYNAYASLAGLGRTHSYFLALMPKARMRSGLSHTELWSQLLKIKFEYVYLHLRSITHATYFWAMALLLKALTGTFCVGTPAHRSLRESREIWQWILRRLLRPGGYRYHQRPFHHF